MEPDFAPGEELDIYRRRDAGKPISEEHEQHFAALWPRQLELLEQMARMHDEQDECVRDEITRYPEGYGWHKTVGGGLPYDWTDSELTRLRPHDWKQARTVRFIRTSRRSVPRQPRVRPRERRARVARRTSSSSTTSSSDPGDGESDPPGSARALWRILERLILTRVRLVLARFGRVVA